MEGKTPREIDLAGTDGGHRAEVIQGLKDLTHYLETHPGVPVPLTVEIQYSIRADSDRHGYEKACRIADILGAQVTGDDSSETGRHFGREVTYRAVYINRDRMAEYNAHMAPYRVTRAERIAAATERAADLKNAARETVTGIMTGSAA